MTPWKRTAWIAGLWLWIPVLVGLIGLFFHMFMSGTKTTQVVTLWFQRSFLPRGDLFTLPAVTWLWVAIGLLLTALVLSFDEDGEFGLDWMSPWRSIAVVLLVLTGSGVILMPVPSALWDNDKDRQRFYGSATVFHVPSVTSPPASVAKLVEGSRRGKDGCDRIGRHDVRSCVKVDNGYPALRWESRTSSLAAARTAMKAAASPVAGVNVMESTFAYQWGSSPNTGQWSAVLDGSGGGTPAYGVAQWDGRTNSAQVCRFGAGNRFERAFGGSGRNSLRNLLADRHPDLIYTDKDIWGYCQGDRPVIVIAVQRPLDHRQRTVTVAAGVLILEGSASGRPDITHRPRVRPGELPGPVYPISLVRTQRDAAQWAAGRGEYNNSFGLEPTGFQTQQANPGEYLLRGADRRLYYVTPLTPRDTSSELFVAYGIVPADQVDSGRLNRYDLYTLADGDPNIADLNALYVKAKSVACAGTLEQFIPLGGQEWRVYGVDGGQTLCYIDVSVNGQVQPRTVQRPTEGTEETTPPPSGSEEPRPSKSQCGRSPTELGDRQLAECLADFADEVRRRANRG
ncbi:hypothetical protein [Actinomadura sp. HBU206391]|uniref:hypothetical protein n=1 Tax=Actinomadura sp. HBU206391 TaxID=2731692 RepID=UPI00164F175B|nr:hypothetical protein [Actinomadura sp. HBU206391]MBC6460819.1 hypothetical protein [Actinomadura sp. HBU206391]